MIIANITTPENSFIQFEKKTICWDLTEMPTLFNLTEPEGCGDGLFFDTDANVSVIPIVGGQIDEPSQMLQQLADNGYPFYVSESNSNIICLDNPDLYTGINWVAAYVLHSDVFPCDFQTIFTAPIVECYPCISPSCGDEMTMCLPIHQNTDVHFQFFRDLQAGEFENDDMYFLGLVRSCDDSEPIEIPATGSTVWSEIEWGEADDDNRMIGIPAQFEDYDYDLSSVFENGECFRIALFQNIITYSYTLSQTPNAVYAFWIMIDGVDTQIANGAVLTDAADMVTLINAYFLAQDITDVATSPASTVVVIISESGHVYGAMTMTGAPAITVALVTVTNAYMRYCSNCLTYIADTCFSSVVKYRSNENSMGFIYEDTMSAFFNLVRLPLFIDKPQPKTKRNTFRLSDGSYKKLSAVIEKEYEGHVGYMADDLHDKLIVALEHDDVQLKSSGATAFQKIITDDANYEIGWLNKPGTNFNLAPASLKVKVDPYLKVNSNCE